MNWPTESWPPFLLPSSRRHFWVEKVFQFHCLQLASCVLCCSPNRWPHLSSTLRPKAHCQPPDHSCPRLCLSETRRSLHGKNRHGLADVRAFAENGFASNSVSGLSHHTWRDRG